jgi:hypothetical protein
MSLFLNQSSLPSNNPSPNTDSIKRNITNSVSNLEKAFDDIYYKNDMAVKWSDTYNKAVFNGNRYISTQVHTEKLLGNAISQQTVEMDTKNRMIQFTEADLKFNQNIVYILYILMIGISMSVLIMIGVMIYDKKRGASPLTSVTTSSPLSYFKTGGKK